MATNKPFIVAHRGMSHAAPENTLAAFGRAMELGVDGIEMDLQLSRDGQLVICHDGTWDRTTDGSGEVRSLSLPEIKRLDAGGWFGPEFSGEQVPTPTEVMELARSRGWNGTFYLELKTSGYAYPGIEERLAALLESYNAVNRVTVSSFNHTSLITMRTLVPGIKTSCLTGSRRERPWRHVVAKGSNEYSPNYREVDDKLVAACHQAGVSVVVWTVNDAAEMRRMQKAGVDGIITDRPDLAQETLRAGGV